MTRKLGTLDQQHAIWIYKMNQSTYCACIYSITYIDVFGMLRADVQTCRWEKKLELWNLSKRNIYFLANQIHTHFFFAWCMDIFSALLTFVPRLSFSQPIHRPTAVLYLLYYTYYNHNFPFNREANLITNTEWISVSPYKLHTCSMLYTSLYAYITGAVATAAKEHLL